MHKQSQNWPGVQYPIMKQDYKYNGKISTFAFWKQIQTAAITHTPFLQVQNDEQGSAAAMARPGFPDCKSQQIYDVTI